MRKNFLKSVTFVGIAFVFAINAWKEGWIGAPSHPKVDSAIRADSAEKSSREKQILFGDLHVHTTYSMDAYAISLPMLNGEGAHPPKDACDFARYCSSLDFWSINDHAEGLTPKQWQEEKDLIRRCNASAGDPKNPDLVSFLGWEWTQMGTTVQDHYGHRNVILKDTEEDKVPARPIAASGPYTDLFSGPPFIMRNVLKIIAPGGNRQAYYDFADFVTDRLSYKHCPSGVPVKELPKDCTEWAATPSELFEKLQQWNIPSLVIPHGTVWGFYTPPGITFDKQLKGKDHNEDLQKLVEIYSGHGNAEEYRPWQEVGFDPNGKPVCNEPHFGYEPSCWRAGEIIRKRCFKEGESPRECELRAAQARENHAVAGVSGFATVPGADLDDWGNSGQCPDCFLPAFNHRPGNSVQYALAITNFDNPHKPRNFRFGFIGSSDSHTARAGNGYKEYWRKSLTETAGPEKPNAFGMMEPAKNRKKPVAYSKPFSPKGLTPFEIMDNERQASFFLTGGLVAVHSNGRDRDSIWDSLNRKEVYATSGDRILLWFDLKNDSGKKSETVASMGSEVRLSKNPTFKVRAVGAFKQKPGCPDSGISGIGAERLQRLCKGECYHPSSERKKIVRIEVVRILPQISPNEPVAKLIQDPWKTLPCKSDPSGCEAEFQDTSYADLGRDAVYYVRAIEEKSPAINGGQLRCEYDDQGRCIKVKPCYGDYRTDPNDDCLANVEERAWSSPIYLIASKQK
ncbi:PF12228 domain protein [Leptospira weilii serovar Ranarum str. ICFT]|uniref:PF12228 domain protein n=1 Tax=Leptospira weilii serovar Ranarum str. ICFT TaxID=1218598 RepID=N1WGD2_9LEPT|nr:DUF3604 domain-containing protein [Leptospira weilii]EMY77985.1 PF12228 domain protein [Leptospira weilii serovar Ranarum str. ICFT]